MCPSWQKVFFLVEYVISYTNNSFSIKIVILLLVSPDSDDWSAVSDIVLSQEKFPKFNLKSSFWNSIFSSFMHNNLNKEFLEMQLQG